MSELGTRTIWNPVPDIDVGFDVVWYHLNTAFNGGIATLGQVGAKPAGNYTISNQDALGAVFRIQRNFPYSSPGSYSLPAETPGSDAGGFRCSAMPLRGVDAL